MLDLEEQKILFRDEADRILQRLESRLTPGGRTELFVTSYWQGELIWARNKATLTSDRRDIRVVVIREIGGVQGFSRTNQLDDVSLDGVVQCAERRAMEKADQRPSDAALPEFVPSPITTTSWSDTTFERTPEQNAVIVQKATEQANVKHLVSAGYLESRGFSLGNRTIDDHGRVETYYGQITQAQCSATVRHPKGTGSGWAGASGYDFAKIDEAAIAARALEKCLMSLDPVRIEPGRYTTILEPQATGALVKTLLHGPNHPMTRPLAESGDHVFWLDEDTTLSRHRSKLGIRIIDERITLSHDPADPGLGIFPLPGVKPVTWIKNGVLQTMDYKRDYALHELNTNDGVIERLSFRMTGGTTSIEEMIATTKRGLLVTRLVPQLLVDSVSNLYTGVTRDGLWLIENGKISKAVRNFRWTESANFVFNNVEALGVPVPIFSPTGLVEHSHKDPQYALNQVIVPPVKVKDFSFTATIDAI